MLRRTVIAISTLVFACWALASVSAQPQQPQQQQQQQTEPRIAFVVGNAGYARGPLPNALNDAGLVAEALRSIGFEIVEGGDLSQADLIRAFREFLGKVEGAGPDAIAFVYFSGHGLAFEGENVLVPVDAQLDRESDIAIQTVRLSDLIRPLAEAPARAKIMMIDAARPSPFAPQGRGIARGLAAIEPPQGMLIAFSAAPGTLAPDGQGPYGAYATAIAEMLRAPGLDLEAAFIRIRSRTHETTQGVQTPWHMAALGDQIELVPPDASALAPPQPPVREPRPMREIGPEEAYGLAIEMDTLDGYTQFVDAYPRHPLTPRVWAIIRARREALAWMRAQQVNTPPAYWTYLRRYPNGMYVVDAERRLRRLSAPFGAPMGFAPMEFEDVPPPLPGEPLEYMDVYEMRSPTPRILREPPPAFFVSLPPPRPRAGPRFLPVPIPIPLVPRLAPAPRRGPPTSLMTPGFPGPRPGAPGMVPPRVGPPGGPPRPLPPGAVPPAPRPPGVVTPGTSPWPPVRPGVGPTPQRPPLPPGVVRPQPAPGVVQPQSAPGMVQPAPGVAGRPPNWDPRRGPPPQTAWPPPGAGRPPQPAPGVATPGRPPGRPDWDGRRGPPPPGVVNRPPQPAQPGVAARPPQPPPGVNRPPGPPPGAGRPPGPPPGFVNRPPGPPPGVVNRPPGPPPVVNRPPPIARPAPPAAPVARPAPPPPPAARPAPAARAPSCPPGKTFRNGACV